MYIYIYKREGKQTDRQERHTNLTDRDRQRDTGKTQQGRQRDKEREKEIERDEKQTAQQAKQGLRKEKIKR